MNYIQDLSDLEWIRELDAEFVIGLDVKESHTAVWGVFLTTLKELKAKLAAQGRDMTCIDVNVAVVGFDWQEVEMLEDKVLRSIGETPFAYRYLIDTVARY